MRLVTAVTTLIQLKRPNYFRPKNPLSEIEFCPRGNIVSPTSGAGQSRRFGRRPAISGLPRRTDKCLQSNDMSAARRPSRVLATDVILDVGVRSRLFLSHHLDARGVRGSIFRTLDWQKPDRRRQI